MSSLRLQARVLTFALCILTVFAAVAEARRPTSSRRRNVAITRATPTIERTLEDRRSQAMSTFLRNDAIRRCWMRQLHRDPTTASRRLDVGLSVDCTGRIVHVDVRDPTAPSLVQCIAATGSLLAPVGPGEAFSAHGTLTLERGE